MSGFKVPNSIPQDLLLIQDIVGTNPVRRQLPESNIEDSLDSSDDNSSDDDSSDEVDEVEADLIVKEQEDTAIP